MWWSISVALTLPNPFTSTLSPYYKIWNKFWGNSSNGVGRVAQSVYRLATGWTVRGSNPGGEEIFRSCPDQPWGPPSLLYNGYRVFPEGKERPGRDADPSPPSSAVGHERVELYLYSPYGPYGLYRASVPVQGYTLPFTFQRWKDLHFTKENCQNYGCCILLKMWLPVSYDEVV